MELDRFVAEVLSGIMAGIKQTEKAAMEHGAVVNPREYADQTYVRIEDVEFDIAVTVETAGTKDAGGRISVMNIGLGGKLESSSRNSSVSRVKFSGPVTFPTVGKIET